MSNRQYIVGAVYYNNYWGFEYKVLAVDGVKVTVQLTKPSVNSELKHNTVGDMWSHYTALDYRDRVISLPIGDDYEP